MRDERVLLNPGVPGTPEVHNDVLASTSRGSESPLGEPKPKAALAHRGMIGRSVSGYS